MILDKKEVLRYLGYWGSTPDAIADKTIDECGQALIQSMEPRNIRREFSLIFPDAERLQIEDMVIPSKNLSRNLKGCEKVVLFAATLGLSADRLIARATATKMSRAVIYQAAAATLIETYCDEINEEIREEYEQKGLYCRPRFSPGYGDVALSHQRDFCRLLDTSRKIGLTVTEGDLLVPIKSVTAIIGLSGENRDCHKKGCEVCDKPDCTFRR